MHAAVVKIGMRVLVSAAVLVASAGIRGASAVPEAGSAASGDSIRVDIRGRLRTPAGSAEQSQRSQVSADKLVWDLDLSGNAALSQAAQGLDGQPIRTTGTYAEQRDGAGVRRVVVAETLKADAARRAGDTIDVTVRGTLRSRVFAIGAETTGVNVTANGVVWELELDPGQLGTAGNLDGRKVLVTGRLTHRKGVEIGDRFVVKARSLKAAN
jgi:hypothetical protein